jgi:hypothetical protein
MRHLRAIAVLLLGLWLVLLGVPGLDFLNRGDYAEPEDREAAPGWALVADVNRTRMDLIAPLELPQRPFRIAQSWGLYRDGPRMVRRLEVYVDGELKHRSLDDEHDWLSSELRSRRLRPVVESSCRYTNSKARNWRGLTAFIADRAVEDFGAEKVALACTIAPFPGSERRETHRMVSKQPGWNPKRAP